MAADLRFVISDTSLVTSGTGDDTQLLAAAAVKSIRTSYQLTNARYPAKGEFNVMWSPTKGRFLYLIMDRAHYINQRLEVDGFAAIMRGESDSEKSIVDCSLNVPAGSFSIPRYSLDNVDSATFSWKFENVAPIITLTGVDISNNVWTKNET